MGSSRFFNNGLKTSQQSNQRLSSATVYFVPAAIPIAQGETDGKIQSNAAVHSRSHCHALSVRSIERNSKKYAAVLERLAKR